jgi:hypothetical protein
MKGGAEVALNGRVLLLNQTYEPLGAVSPTSPRISRFALIGGQQSGRLIQSAVALHSAGALQIG